VILSQHTRTLKFENIFQDLDDDPELDHISVPHHGAVNRLRVMPQQPGIMATWAETGKVLIWDLNAPLHAIYIIISYVNTNCM